MMWWLNAGISALVTYVFISLFDLSLFHAACVFLAVFMVLSITGSSFGVSGTQCPNLNLLGCITGKPVS